MTTGPLILGATGQLGRALRRADPGVWSDPPLWQSRKSVSDHLHWDVLNAPAPDAVKGACAVVSFAGGPHVDAQTEEALALAACDLGETLGVPVLIASSQAAYGVMQGPMAEGNACAPTSDYGKSKLAMERAVRGRACCLRLGNLPGVDMLFAAARKGPVALDQWADGQTPVRSMIGIVTLARALDALCQKRDLPDVLNLAQPEAVSMQALLEAAGAAWHPVAAPETAVRHLELDLTRMMEIMPLPAATAPQLVDEAHRVGCWP